MDNTIIPVTKPEEFDQSFEEWLQAIPIKEDVAIWKISPGEGAFLWQDFLTHGITAVGWLPNHDYQTLGNKDDTIRTLEENDNPTSAVTPISQFRDKIQPGHIIIANHGQKKIVGIGRVTGVYRPPRSPENANIHEHYQHQRSVHWRIQKPVTLTNIALNRRTITTIDQQKWHEIKQAYLKAYPGDAGIRQALEDLEKGEFMIEAAEINPSNSNSALRDYEGPQNLILYGPPGTGKTYSTIEKAVKIVDGEAALNHKAAKTRWDALLNEGRIVFTTFHQSYGYEDFVEGIRPVFNEGQPGALRYECRDGVFKKLAVEALFACLQPSAVAPGKPTFDILWTELTRSIEDDPDRTYPGLTSASEYRLELTPRGLILGTNTKPHAERRTNPLGCSRSNAEMVWDAYPTRPAINSADVMMALQKGSHATLVALVVNQLKQLETTYKPNLDQPEPISDYNTQAEIVQSFLRGSLKNWTWAPERADQYVLVIDEINRGNISKIFGELITLLEDDKRFGGDNALVATLPYSGERFAVPANLYVLGTMNTADKSIALVDIALRRRFEFDELMPNFAVCQGLTPEMKILLQELNRRITVRKDRDHQIGHAYFMNVMDTAGFDLVFRKKIIPLLQEYFFNDWEGLRYVLGEKDTGRFIRPIDAGNDRGARNRWRWWYEEEGATSASLLQMLRDNLLSNAAAQNSGLAPVNALANDAESAPYE